jgi:aminopeptidase
MKGETLADSRVTKLAQILVEHSTRISPGDRVIIEATTAAEPLVRALYREILEQGGHPHLLLEIPEQEKELFTFGNDQQLAYVNAFQKLAYEEFEARIRVHSLTNTQALSDFPPQKQSQRQKAKALIISTQLERGAKEEFKWVTTLYPTKAYAAEAGMSLKAYQDFVYRACHADQEHPIMYWNQVQEKQARAKYLFQGQDQIHLSGPNIDLTLSVKGRTFINSYGIHNMPDGEIYTGPVEESANGWVRFSYPAIYNGVVVRGIELTFKDGKVIEASAEEKEDFLFEMLDSDTGSRYLGEFAVGTNAEIQQFTGNILFDEKIGGTVHMALGAGYPQTGSGNKSMIHWDMICDMREDSEIVVDGEVVYQNGKFV